MDQRSEAAISRRDGTMNDACMAITNGARSSLRRCGQGDSEGKGRLISIKRNVQVRETEGRFDSALARVVVGRFEREVKKKSRESK